ncbi:unnamed protein product [Rhizophagus irregularis]|nr:unnamed protein product [Rhizophagus irregularis]
MSSQNKKYFKGRFIEWSSGNKKLIMFEWIPYNQFNEIKETGKNGSITVYSAIWKDGPLHKENEQRSYYTRYSNQEVALKCLHNLQNPVDSLINEAKKYSTKNDNLPVLYGISQNPDTSDYILVQNYFFWSSGNEIIDDFIQERLSNTYFYDDAVFEWIPYNQFNEIKETGKNGSITVYSAIWRNGPLHYNYCYRKYTRNSNKEVALKCLHNLQNPVDSLINEVKKHPIKNDRFLVLYGISQNPDTSDFILVLTWANGNEKIDELVRERQLNIKSYDDIVFEWIPYNQFNEIRETGKNGSMITVYSAIWSNGPLRYNYGYKKYTRDSNKEVALKCLHSLQNPVNSLINEVKKHPMKNDKFLVLYGISQNPDTSDYILVLTWTSGNKEIDAFIQERQLNVDSHEDLVFEWIPYNQFNEIREMGKNGSITVYSALWRNGPLYKKYRWSSYHTRDSNKEVALKCLHNLQNPVDSLINEAKKYSTKNDKLPALCGISQNPDTKRQLNICFYDDLIFEWIPYNQFNKIKEISKNGSITLYSAIWKNGPLHKKDECDSDYTRDSNKEVALKCLHNLQNPVDSLINEAKKYSTKNDRFPVLYGISQNPDTSNYILVQKYLTWTSGNEKIDDFIQTRQLNVYFYHSVVFEWIPYNQFYEIKETSKNGSITVYSAIWRNGPLHKKDEQSSYFKRGSNKEVALKCLHNLQNPVDSLINEAKKYSTKNDRFPVLYGISQNPDTIFEWIPYNQFYEIKETSKNGSITVYSAIWGNGPFHYSNYTRDSNKEVALKCLHNLQNSVESLINEAEKYSTRNDNFFVLYGISQNPDTIFEWIPYNQFNEIEETSKNHSITVYSAIWKNGPLHYNYDYRKYTRDSNKEVALKCLHNLQNPVDFLINEARKYSTKNDRFPVLYGISQNPDTSDYILVQKYLTWTSGNEKINNFIQKRQLNVYSHHRVVFELIPYNQFYEIKETSKNGSITVYSAIWRNGPLCKKVEQNPYFKRDSNKEVTLKSLHNLKNPVESLINEAKKYSTRNDKFLVLYGISQNPDTSDYILVQKYLTCTSGNEKIDDFIQERQLSISPYYNVVFEWIPYNQFNDIKETDKNCSISVYSAIWRNGPLNNSKYKRSSNKEVSLKYLHNLQNSVDSLINEAKKYSNDKLFVLYGISQNPDTSDYILVINEKYCFICDEIYTDIQHKWCEPCNFMGWKSGDDKIDSLIQLKINELSDTRFKWIPYNQFNKIRNIGKGHFVTVDSATWEYEVALVCFDSSLKFLNKVKESDNNFEMYGISQNPDKKDYILVLQNEYCTEYGKTYCKNCGGKYGHDHTWCKQCLITATSINSRNEKIDNLVQEMRLKINSYINIIFEWIPYDQFNCIKEIGKGGFATVYSAVWKDGPLKYDVYKEMCIRIANKKVALKCLNHSQYAIDKFLKETRAYSINKMDDILNVYGISQDPNTKDYIIVIEYADGGSYSDWISINYKDFDWRNKMQTLLNIVKGLKGIHQKKKVHRDFHTGNILVLTKNFKKSLFISDMGLCEDVNNASEVKNYGVIPYMAPEVLRGNPHTQAADIYSFGMVMYFTATGKQPFSNCAHDHHLTLEICNGIRPEINELEVPKCYTDLMKRCWNSNPDNRPNATEINVEIKSFYDCYSSYKKNDSNVIEIRKQFEEAEIYRKSHLSSFEKNEHPEAIYTSRLLNPFTKDLSKYDKSECLSCVITD